MVQTESALYPSSNESLGTSRDLKSEMLLEVRIHH
jgi:hypothetical protein